MICAKHSTALSLFYTFEVIRQQGVPESYMSLFACLYSNQYGSVNGSNKFAINRGVKQGDAISAMLFNAGLEIAFFPRQQKPLPRQWPAKYLDARSCVGGAGCVVCCTGGEDRASQVSILFA